MNILFLTLKCFSATGGIEKFNRAFCKSLVENAQQENWQVEVVSAYDNHTDEKYLPAKYFTGFAGKRAAFMLEVLNKIRKVDVVIFSHINLAPLANIAALLFPSKKRIGLTHGREVWEKLPDRKRHALIQFHQTWTVSRFTAEILINKQGVLPEKLKIFPNTLDPFFAAEQADEIPDLRSRYHIEKDEKVILTVARLANTEKFKGYDRVLEVLPAIAREIPKVKYVICGKWDTEEKKRIDALINALKLHNLVVLTGYIEDFELEAHYRMANLFVLPSRKEGFGIVFLEAAWCGLPVIAGNADGSVEALLHGALGSLVDPADSGQLQEVIIKALSYPLTASDTEFRKSLISKHFGFDVFKKRQAAFLKEIRE